jgi:pentatricopeptide repeat protein
MKQMSLSDNTVTYTSLVDALVKSEHMSFALQIFQEMKNRNIPRNLVTYGAIIAGYSRENNIVQILRAII